jgi:hypothetical protein
MVSRLCCAWDGIVLELLCPSAETHAHPRRDTSECVQKRCSPRSCHQLPVRWLPSNVVLHSLLHDDHIMIIFEWECPRALHGCIWV